jgi:hypothetical protein
MFVFLKGVTDPFDRHSRQTSARCSERKQSRNSLFSFSLHYYFHFNSHLIVFLSQYLSFRAPFLSVIIQKAFIEVNEEGTKAAAATFSMMMTPTGVIMRQRKVFCADHAFIYWIQHLPSQQVLFVGTVCNPSLTS